MIRYSLFYSALAWVLTSPCTAAIYVSPNGNDQATGSKRSPVSTVQRALKISVTKNDPSIILADGVYFASEPILITADHSGSSTKPRTIKAANEGKAIISAGQALEVVWTPFQNGIYQAKIPADIDLTKGFDGLYIDGQSPRMARFPNYDRKARWLKGSSAEAFSPARIKTWSDPSGGILHAMHPAHWGGNHWTITGKKSATECTLEGGWMNNRGGGIHPNDRFVENIFEELDDTNEWYLNRETRTLYFKPFVKPSREKSTIIFSLHESCVRIEGSEQRPVQHLIFDGISFRHTTRTFMKTKEPLLRSDWKIYRGGAVYLEGSEHIKVLNSEFTELGGNAYFASGYNRSLSVSGCHFYNIGAGAINFVGLGSAVYNAKFDPYGAPDAWDKINKKDRGPKSSDYPRLCTASDSLIHDIGLVEKQVAGVQISAAHKVTVQHLSIYDVPRAGINIGENAFGGHLIEHCDVFDTVQESSDHGSFNSWGRDRFWHTNYGAVNRQVVEYPKLPVVDMLGRNIIRNSRWRCDHGWDIDLDDGSSGYLVENNLCLGGGIKLREGYYREVRNNLVVGNGFHPHVWFEKSDDIIEHNIWAAPVAAIRLSGKGKVWDHNIYLSEEALTKAQAYGVDEHGAYASLKFTDQKSLDYTFKANTQVTKAGFKPFDLTKFGVQKPALKKQARTPNPPTPPTPMHTAETLLAQEYPVIGALFKNVTTLGEVSATGLPDKNGAMLLNVENGGLAQRMGLEPRDVIRSLNGKPVNSCLEFFYAWAHADASKPVKIKLWRTQRSHSASLPPFPGVSLTAAEAIIQGGPVYDRGKNYIGRWNSPTATLQWTTTLKPNASYRVLINQATDAKEANSWTLKGLGSPFTGQTFTTKGWEDFQTMLLKPTAQSGVKANHTLTLSLKASKGALMNFREILLIQQ